MSYRTPIVVGLSCLMGTVGGAETNRQSQQIGPKRIVAEELQIVDSNGTVRISLGMQDGLPVQKFYDEKGVAHLLFYGPDSRKMSAIHILGKEGERGISLGIEHRDCPVLRINDANGVALVTMASDPSNEPVVHLLAPKTGRSLQFGIKGKTASLVAKDEKDQTLWSVPEKAPQ